jgi:hypothetical protein
VLSYCYTSYTGLSSENAQRRLGRPADGEDAAEAVSLVLVERAVQVY